VSRSRRCATEGYPSAFVLCAALLSVLVGCADTVPTSIADADAIVRPDAAWQAQAFTMDVNLRTGSISISSPTSGVLGGSSPFSSHRDAAPGVLRSLLGVGVVSLQASNYSASAIGAVTPGKILIRFDLTVHNLVNVALSTSTFPVPPAGATGVQAFPLEIAAAQEPGGTLLPSPPETGPVQPSLDWSGAPHNFLDTTPCGPSTNNCFRYEPFATIAPLGVSSPSTVGFLVAPTVTEFRVTMLLAADLQSPTAR
jgi:hypothetical protein